MAARRSLTRKIFLVFFSLFLFFNALVMGVTVFVYYHPRAGWDFVHEHFLPKDLEITWRDLRHHLNAPSWSEWNLRWEVDGLRVLKGDPSLSVPLDRLSVDVSLDILALRLVVHDFRVEGAEPVLYEPKPEPHPLEQSFYQRFRALAGYLTSLQRLTVLERLNVDLTDIRIGREPLRLSVSLSKKDSESSRLDYAVKAPGLTKALQSLALHGHLELNEFKSERPFLFFHASAQGHYGGQLEGAISYFKGSAVLQARGDIDIHQGKLALHLNPKVKAALSRAEVKINLVTDAEGIPKMQHVSDLNAQILIPQQDGKTWSDLPSAATVGLPLAWDGLVPDMRPDLEGSCQCVLPKTLRLSAEGKVWLKSWVQPGEHLAPALQADFKLESITNKLFSLQIAGGLEMTHSVQQTEIVPKVDVDAVLFSFQSLRRYLDKRGVLIPAPLDVLDGTVSLAAHGPVEVSKLGYETPLSMRMDLKSEHQSVQLTSDFVAKADSKFQRIDIDTKAKIKSLQLELPPLEPITGVPRMSRDSRVKMKPPEPASKVASRFKLALSVEVETESPGAIRLLSKLADPYIPITLHIAKTTSQVEDGQVHIEPFKIRYLRRTVNVEFFNLDVHPIKSGDFPIEGRLRIDQTDYKVFIAIHGTTAAPQFELSSTPFLPRDDIISVLLYDRVSSQLVSADAETAGSFQAAMADRAIGLFGLWAFAMTPIRSFSYNSMTKVYTATVQLADGLTAGVGTDWEHAAHLEIRKRVSKRWVLTASYSPSEDQRDVGKVVLQWEKRF